MQVFASVDYTGAMLILQSARMNIGFTVLLAAVVSQWFMSETPRGVLIAAIWAGGVQMFGGSLMWTGLGGPGSEGSLRMEETRSQTSWGAGPGARHWETPRGTVWVQQGGYGHSSSQTVVRNSPGGGFWWSVMCDAVAGWVFVKVAKGRGINCPRVPCLASVW